MRILFLQFSGLLAALTFADRFFSGTPAGAAVGAAVVAACCSYGILVVGDLAVQRLLEFFEPADAPSAESETTPKDRAGALAA